jgi:hypothetical protein
MGESDGWASLKDLPEKWVPPEELRQPTELIRLNLAILILAADTVGNNVLELIGEYVSEEARLHNWFGTEARKTLGIGRIAELANRNWNAQRHIYEAWLAYEDERKRLGRAREAKKNLIDVLRRHIAESAEMRGAR